ncbi:MAG: hypothetical protein QW512_02110 [Thermofilaceae archaeon]
MSPLVSRLKTSGWTVAVVGPRSCSTATATPAASGLLLRASDRTQPRR